IVYEERVTRDETRVELSWRHLAVKRWAGRSLVPADLEQCKPLLAADAGGGLSWRPLGSRRWPGPSLVPADLEQCKPLLADDAGVVVLCRQQGGDSATVQFQRLVRLRGGTGAIRLA